MTLPTHSIQEEVFSKLSLVDKELNNLKEVTESTMKTNGEFRYNPNSYNQSNINIHKLKNMTSLISILSFLINKEEYYEKASNTLGLKQYPPFVWLSYTLEDWTHDIRVRMTVLQSSDKKHKLLEAKRVLESMQSEEVRAKKALEDISGLLG